MPSRTSLPAVVAAGPGAARPSVRTLVANVRFADVDHGRRVLMVSSGDAGEGKSSIAISLALSLAEDGSSVLLVDADLRRPSIARVTGLGVGRPDEPARRRRGPGGHRAPLDAPQPLRAAERRPAREPRRAAVLRAARRRDRRPAHALRLRRDRHCADPPAERPALALARGGRRARRRPGAQDPHLAAAPDGRQVRAGRGGRHRHRAQRRQAAWAQRLLRQRLPGRRPRRVHARARVPGRPGRRGDRGGCGGRGRAVDRGAAETRAVEDADRRMRP